MPGGFRERRYGDVHGAASAALGLRQGVRQANEALMTREPCIVQAYDAVAQRVTVRLKNQPEALPVAGVPIDGTGGRWRTILPIAVGDVGTLDYFRSDSRDSFQDKNASKPLSRLMHTGRGATFRRGPMLVSDPLLPSSMLTLLAEAGVSVAAVAGIFDVQTGAAMLITSDGDVILRGRNVYFLGLDGTIAGSKAVAFEGSTVSGAGPVTSGSANVKVSQ